MHIKCDTINHCILTTYTCDGQYDCYDKSDESRCSNVTSLCSDMYYLCSSGECISRAHQCDCRADCNDGSDELRCQTAHITAIILNGMYRDRLTVHVSVCFLT